MTEIRTSTTVVNDVDEDAHDESARTPGTFKVGGRGR